MDKPLSFAWALPGVEAVFRVVVQVGSDEFSHCDGVQLGRNDVIEPKQDHIPTFISHKHTIMHKSKKKSYYEEQTDIQTISASSY